MRCECVKATHMRANQLVAVLAPLLEMRGGLLLRGFDVLVVDDIVIAPHLRLALWQRPQTFCEGRRF